MMKLFYRLTNRGERPMTDRYLIVGLGNPGQKYADTRHNVGFWTVDELARRWSITGEKSERRAITLDGMIRDKRVLLVKPQTFMNLSGEAVRSIVDFYRFDIDKIMVIYDDLDVEFGMVRLRMKGSAGGQKGMKNIIQHLGTNEINRARIGIGRPPGTMDPAKFVLNPFRGDDLITARLMVDRAADAVETWLVDGIDLAMSRHNGSVEEPA